MLGGTADNKAKPVQGRHIYDEAVREAVIVAWEASDRICGKRFKAALPNFADVQLGVAREAGQREVGRAYDGATRFSVMVVPAEVSWRGETPWEYARTSSRPYDTS